MPGDIAGGPGDGPDGFVGISDLNRILGNWNQTCDPGDWTQGDITGDGQVGIEDLNIVLGHYNQSDPDPFLGTNVGPIEYWKSHWVFVDVMKMAREWQKSGGATEFEQDADGWPTSIMPSSGTLFAQVFVDLDGAYPAGDYVLTYEGTADVTVTGDVASVTQPDPGNPRRKIVTVLPDVLGIQINITNISGSDPIRNIRLWMPGFEDAQSPFHPLFIQRLRPFKVLRFMDWQKINSSPEVQWSDRKKPTHAFQNDNADGVALEYIIQLCNELNADPWFCMPAKANDNYVTQFAQYVKDNLDNPDATIYVEYSNELWNQAPKAGFTQFQWLEEQATVRVGTTVHIRDNEWFHQWAIESINDFDIWETVFANDPHDRDIVRIIAGQKTNVWIMQKLIPWTLDPNDPNGKNVLFDAIACSTYFYSKTDDPTLPPNPTASDFLQVTLSKIQSEDADNYADYAHEARKLSDPITYPQTYTGRTIDFISYEGGQHYIPFNDPALSTATALEIQRHPLIYQAYVDNIRVFRQAGGESDPGVHPWGGKLYMVFNSVGKFTDRDTFGHFETQNESINNAPKHRAVVGGGGR